MKKERFSIKNPDHFYPAKKFRNVGIKIGMSIRFAQTEIAGDSLGKDAKHRGEGHGNKDNTGEEGI